MKRMWRAGLVSGLMVVIVLAGLIPAAAQSGDRISRPGVYQGYSAPLYDGWQRFSQYVAVRDGTRLAVDIFRPTLNGQLVEDPLPVIWTHHRYHRANVENGQVKSILDQAPALQTLVSYGYVVAAVDVRGGGASYGTRQGEFTREESQDAYDMTEWFAAQPWSTGAIGMYGLSYLGITQYMAASTKPPHLKAIFPEMAMFDLYSFTYPGGVLNKNFLYQWATGNILLDKVLRAAPVDEDPDGSLLDEAVAQHRDNWNIYDEAVKAPYRDSLGPGDIAFYSLLSPSTYLDDINASGVAIYTLGGWYDMWPRDALTWFNNLTVPQKIVMTPWSHNGSGGFDLVAEHVRWFDYWLKGIDNGIMDEPKMTYVVMGAPEATAWRTTDQWPLPNQQLTSFYLSAGPSGSVASANDGLLSPDAPTTAGQDDYTVDYTTTTGPKTRWTDGYGGGFSLPNMVTNDEKGLTYTTPVLAVDTEITGHPVLHLWVTASTDDADFMAYLEEVYADGHSQLISEGVLRASDRAVSTPAWNNLGLPFHRGAQADSAPLPQGEIVELVFDLLPTSNIFDAGHRLRLTITGADADTYQTTPVDPAPVVSIYRGPDHASYVVLPIIPAP